jgi:short-subunit dehydrogenase
LTATRFHDRSGGSVSRIAAAFAQSPEQVVDAAMAALARRREPTVVSGAKNKAFAALARLRSRRALVEMMG